MSQDVKRKRLQTTKQEVETKKTVEIDFTENANVPINEFDWDAHQLECPSRGRVHNSKVNAPKGWKVYSTAPYAQDFLNMLTGQDEDVDVIQQLKIQKGGIYDGVIETVNSTWVSVDIGYRESVYVSVAKEEASIRGQFEVGNDVKVQVLEYGGSKGYVLGSISAGAKTAIVAEIMESIEDGSTGYAGTVTEMIPGGGYVVRIQGIDCFMPGSLAGINKLVDFQSIIGSDMYVVPVSFSEKRGTIVVSHREYLKALIPSRVEELKENIGEEITGMVTGSAKYGVFVEFNECLTGMVHVNDLNPETLSAHKSRQIMPGSEITFKIKEVVSDTKIILTQLDQSPSADLWDGIEDRIKTNSEVIGTVRAVKDYGIFIDVEKGVAGLLHISEIEDVLEITDIKPGDKITVRVTRIDASTRKIFLKI
jgi:small subunit ribosomal protein S1